MKKVFLLIVALLLLGPLGVSAASPSVSNLSVTGDSSGEVGKALTVNVDIKFSNISELGVKLIDLEFNFDDAYLEVVNISSSNYSSEVYEENGKYYIRANSMAKNLESYSAKVIFKPKKAVDNTTIKTGSIVAEFMPKRDGDGLYIENESDKVRIKTSLVKTKSISVKSSSTSNTSDSKTGSSSTSKGSSSSSTSDKKVNIDDGKSNNNYLKNLSIENYDIKFDKEKHVYEVEVKKDVNTINLKVEPEDSKATYDVEGADDLKKNDYKVTVKVTAENGDVNTYIVNVKNDQKVEVKDDRDGKIPTKYFIIGGIVAAIIIIVIIIIYFIAHGKDRKLEKSLDEM